MPGVLWLPIVAVLHTAHYGRNENEVMERPNMQPCIGA